MRRGQAFFAASFAIVVIGLIPIPAQARPIVTLPPPPGGTEGVSTSFSLGSFTDVPGTDTVTVEWGDGTLTTFSQSPGPLAGQSHTYTEEGTYSVIIFVQGATGSAEGPFTVPIADAPLSIDGTTPPSYVAGVFLTADLLTFLDANGGIGQRLFGHDQLGRRQPVDRYDHGGRAVHRCRLARLHRARLLHPQGHDQGRRRQQHF